MFFFFQAEDGIRDRNVTGVQTCALPILGWLSAMSGFQGHTAEQRATYSRIVDAIAVPARFALLRVGGEPAALAYGALRSEERRVGKEWRCGWGAVECQRAG